MSDAITIDQKSLRDIVDILGANEKHIRPAMRRAVSRVTRWAGNEMRRRVSKQIKVTGRALKGRMIVKLYDHNEERSGYVWLGMNPVDLKYFGPRKTATGVTAGPATRPHAFIVWRIKGRPVGHVFQRVGKSRFPIEKADGVSIEDQSSIIIEQIRNEIPQRLEKEFEHELQWQTRK